MPSQDLKTLNVIREFRVQLPPKGSLRYSRLLKILHGGRDTNRNYESVINAVLAYCFPIGTNSIIDDEVVLAIVKRRGEVVAYDPTKFHCTLEPLPEQQLSKTLEITPDEAEAIKAALLMSEDLLNRLSRRFGGSDDIEAERATITGLIDRYFS